LPLYGEAPGSMRDPDRGTRRRRSWRFNFPPRPTRWRSGVSYPRATGARLTIAKHAYVRSHAHRVEVTSPLATAPSRGARPYLERLSPRTIAQGQAAPAGVWSLRVPSSGLRTVARRPWRVTIATRSEVFARCTLTFTASCKKKKAASFDRAVRSPSAPSVCSVGAMARSEPLLSASEQAAVAKNEPLLTATEQAAACSSCKSGSSPRKADNCGDFLRRSHPDYAGQRSPLEYCVSEFR
jgi:hypothetical protein